MKPIRSAPHRRRLLGLAYRMLGSRTDAEDVVQDAISASSTHDMFEIRKLFCHDRWRACVFTS